MDWGLSLSVCLCNRGVWLLTASLRLNLRACAPAIARQEFCPFLVFKWKRPVLCLMWREVTQALTSLGSMLMNRFLCQTWIWWLSLYPLVCKYIPLCGWVPVPNFWIFMSVTATTFVTFFLYNYEWCLNCRGISITKTFTLAYTTCITGLLLI